MSKKFFHLCLCAIALSGLFFVSCNDEESSAADEPAKIPALSSETESVVVDFLGGDYGFEFTLANAAAVGHFDASADVDWISDFVVSESDVTFTVGPNTEETTRSGYVTVSYTYGGLGEATLEVEVLQTGTSITLNVTPTYIAASSGGESLSFRYSLSSSVHGDLVAGTDVDWISNVVVGDNAVTFDVAPNHEATRSGDVTLSYSYSGTLLATASVLVYQTGLVTEIEPSTTELTVSSSGGDVSFTYNILNGTDDGEVSVSVSEDWFTAVDADGTVTVTVEANSSVMERQGVVTLTYAYGEGQTTSTDVTITQSGIGITGTYSASAHCYGQYGGDQERTWTVHIHDNDGTNYTNSEYAYFVNTPTYRESIAGRTNGDQTYAVFANLTDGKIVYSSDPNKIHLRSSGGYKTFVAIEGYDASSYGTTLIGTSVEFTYDAETDTWTSNYGVLDADCDLTTGQIVDVYASSSYAAEGWTGIITMKRTGD